MIFKKLTRIPEFITKVVSTAKKAWKYISLQE
jgi:hypothetical protein